jgi:predicted membrane protein
MTLGDSLFLWSLSLFIYSFYRYTKYKRDKTLFMRKTSMMLYLIWMICCFYLMMNSI